MKVEYRYFNNLGSLTALFAYDGYYSWSVRYKGSELRGIVQRVGWKERKELGMEGNTPLWKAFRYSASRMTSKMGFGKTRKAAILDVKMPGGNTIQKEYNYGDA